VARLYHGIDRAGRVRRRHQFARRGERPCPTFRSRARSPQIVRAKLSVTRRRRVNHCWRWSIVDALLAANRYGRP
jgi:hypothetical protein